MNAFDRGSFRLQISSVAGINQSLWIDFGLVLADNKLVNSSAKNLLQHQMVEPGADSVVESAGSDCLLSLFLRFLIPCLALSPRPNLINSFYRGSLSIADLFCGWDSSKHLD